MNDEVVGLDAAATAPKLAIAIAGLIAVAASIYIAPGVEGVFGAGLACIMLAIAVTDWRRFIVPDVLNALAAALCLIELSLTVFEGELLEAIGSAAIRAATMAALFYLFRLAYRRARGWEGMGLGDVKLAAVAGVWLSWSSLPIVVEIAAVSGLAVVLVKRWRSGQAIDPLTKLPFGAFLAPAIWLCWFIERWRG